MERGPEQCHRAAGAAVAGHRRRGARHGRDHPGDRRRPAGPRWWRVPADGWCRTVRARRRPPHHAAADQPEPADHLAQRGAARGADPRRAGRDRACAFARAGVVGLAGLPAHRRAFRHDLPRGLRRGPAVQAPLQRGDGEGRAGDRRQPLHRRADRGAARDRSRPRSGSFRAASIPWCSIRTSVLGRPDGAAGAGVAGAGWCAGRSAAGPADRLEGPGGADRGDGPDVAARRVRRAGGLRPGAPTLHGAPDPSGRGAGRRRSAAYRRRVRRHAGGADAGRRRRARLDATRGVRPRGDRGAGDGAAGDRVRSRRTGGDGGAWRHRLACAARRSRCAGGGDRGGAGAAGGAAARRSATGRARRCCGGAPWPRCRRRRSTFTGRSWLLRSSVRPTP